MQFSFRLLLCFAILTADFAAFAQENSPPPVDPVAQLLNDAHDSLHGHDDAGKNKFRAYVWDWLKNFDVKGFALGTYRFLNVNLQSPQYREHALNLAFLLPISHLTEMAAGPVAVYSAHSMGVDTSIQVAIGAAGTLITLPGLDPLCLIFLSSYKFKPVQRALTESRLVIYQVSKAAAQTLGLNRFALSLFSHPTTFEKLLLTQDNGIPLRLEELSDPDWVQRKLTRVTYYRSSNQNEPLFYLDIAEEPSQIDGHLTSYVSSLKLFGEISAQEKKEMAKWLKDYGSNVKNAVLNLADAHIKNNDALESQYHVVNFETDKHSRTTIAQFRPFALKQNFRKQNCTSLLTD